MDIEAARTELIRAWNASGDAGERARAAQAVLIGRGLEALGLTPRPGLSLAGLIAIAEEVSPTQGRREFAVLLVHAIGIDGLLPLRGETERVVRGFLERALLNPLRRAGYPFDGSAYDKRLALAGLHATIDEHLRPPEPSIPRWIHGVGPRDDDQGGFRSG